ncbi:MAG: RNA polymerase sigma factor [Caulobacteraceae bacterium]
MMPSAGIFVSGLSQDVASIGQIVGRHAERFDTLAPMSDAEICQRLRAGEDGALRLLMDRHGKMVLRLAANVLGDQEEAEDVAQEVFLSLWKNKDAWVEGDAKFSTWIHRVTINKAIDKRRRRRASPESSEFISALIDANGSETIHSAQESHLDQADLSRSLAAEINRLPETQARALRLYYFDGRDIVTIAQQMDSTEQAVRSLLKRGRQALRTRLTSKKTSAAHDAFAIRGYAR